MLLFCIIKKVGHVKTLDDKMKSEIPVRIVMLGDSITHGGNWQELLNRNDVINAGMPGWTTEQIYWLIKDYVEPNKPELCFYMAGINDYSLGISPNRIEKNQKRILDAIHACGTMPVYQTLLYQLGNFYGNQKIDWLNSSIEEHCKEHGYEFLDLRPWLCRNDDLKEEFTYDGTHLTEDAYIPWAKALLPVLEKFGL